MSTCRDVIAGTGRSGGRGGNSLPFTVDTCAPLPGVHHVIQWDMITCTADAIVEMCSRRFGKTTGFVIRVAKRSSEGRRRTLYIHHTLENGRQQFFIPLKERLEAHKVPFSANETTVHLVLNNRSLVQVVGCDALDEVKKKLGFFWDEIIIDECQAFRPELLKALIEDTLIPTLIDHGGTLILGGTPSAVNAGPWVKYQNSTRFKQFRGCMLDNPIMTREKIQNEYSKIGYTVNFEKPEENEALVRREVFGHQVEDPAGLEYPYRPDKNDFPVSGIPFLDSPNWRYAIGVDVGGARPGNDKDALVKWGWRTDDGTHTLWEREVWEFQQQDQEMFCARVLDSFRRDGQRPVVSIVGDTGGAGANKFFVWLEARMGGLLFSPKPTSVDTSIRFLNDDIRAGRIKIDPLGLIARDCKLCTVPETYHSNVMPAARYAHHGAYAFLGKDKTDKQPKTPAEIEAAIDERRVKQWLQEERSLNSEWGRVGGWGDWGQMGGPI